MRIYKIKINPIFIQKLILSIVVSSIVLTGAIAGIAIDIDNSKSLQKQSDKIIRQHEFTERIAIVYDSSHETILSTAFSIFESLRMVYSSIDLITATEYEDLTSLSQGGHIIFIYLFDTTLEGVKFGDELIPWETFITELKVRKATQHVLGMGNGPTMEQLVTEADINIHIEGSEVLDLQLAYFHSMWSVGTCLEGIDSKYQDVGLDIQKLGLKYFADNINPLVERNFQPVDPIGEEDINAKQKRYDEKKEDFPQYLTPKFDIKELPEEKRPTLYVGEQVGAGDFLLGLIPGASGLQGPLGGIVDILLETLISLAGGDMYLKEDTVENIMTAIEVIKEVFGFFQGGKLDAGSALKGLFDIIKTAFPFAEEYEAYFDLFVDAISLLRGDFSEISSVIGTALDLLLGDLMQMGSETVDTVKSIVTKVIGVTPSVVDAIKDSDNFLEALMGIFNENFLEGLVNKFLNTTLGIPDASSYVAKILPIMKGIMSFLTSFDFSKFISEYLPDLLIDAFGYFTDQAPIKKIVSIVEMAMSALKFVDKPLSEVFQSLLEEFAPGLLAEADKMQNLVTTVINRISQAKENTETSMSDFKSDLTAKINAIGLSSSAFTNEIKNIVIEVSSLVAGALNPDFSDIQNLASLNSTLSLVLDIIGSAGTGSALSADAKETILEIFNAIMGTIAVVTNKDEIKRFMSKSVDNFVSQFKDDPITFVDKIMKAVLGELANTSTYEKIKNFAEMGLGCFNLIMSAKESSINGIMRSLLQNVGFSLFEEYFGEDISVLKDIMSYIFPSFFGVKTEDLPTPKQLISQVLGLLNLDSNTEQIINLVLEVVFGVKDIFNDGLRWLFGQLMDWVSGQIEKFINDLTGMINGAFEGSDVIPPEWEGELPIGLGDFSLFTIKIQLGLYPNFGFDGDAFTNWILDIMFAGLNPFDDGVGDFFAQIFSFFSITPVFKAGFELGGFGTESNPLMAFMLESLGLELNFSGGGFVEVSLMSIKGGVFSWEDFFKVLGWGFHFTITISKTFTILDFLTAGAGGGVLNSVGKYIGLDAITITITFGLSVEVIKRAASADGPEEGSLTLKISICAAVHFGIDLLIVGIAFDGSCEIILTFFQDLVEPAPLRVFLEIIVKFGVTLTFLFADLTAEFTWKPLNPSPYELTSTDEGEMENNGAMGMDADGDGLSNDYESTIPGLNPNAEDTDGDGLSDKFETQTSKTDPILPDTDSDGLDDYFEYYSTKTNPKQPDTDWDGLTDYEEAIIIGTNPLDTDTDSDGIDDCYEVNHPWEVSNITQSVPFVVIGGKEYVDRTDPLNPDTDGDGLLDGEEGERGPYYGLPDLHTNSSTGSSYYPDSPPIIFNGGYTHPLDNDTDDDSYWQLYDGFVVPGQERLKVKIQDGSYIYTTDWWEVKGMPIVYMIEGEPVLNMTFTNPCNPDTDSDTGISPYERNGPWPYDMDNMIYTEGLNSDGYELSLDPPSDPCDSDTDDDGLIDGLEGTLKLDSNHTHYNNPDTDGDGLGDMQELLLGSDPRHTDSDRDMVTDGEEYFKYGTSVFNPDQDFDGLTDGEELFWFHTNPFSADSDGDRIGDWMELMVYFTDPMDEDTDNDRLGDYEEIFIYLTNPFDSNTDSEDWNDINNNGYYDGYWEFDPNADENGNGVWDGDYIRDGDEVFGTYGYKTDPLVWDTDYDSITYFIVYSGGKIDYSFRMSDGEEILFYGTNPTYGDSDFDGIGDGWEVYIGTDNIPGHTAIPLDPLNNDTDGDFLWDGQELMIKNYTSLIYPYIAFYYETPLLTSPVSNDSDNDGLSDYDEIRIYSTDAGNWDTDNDTLSDYDELVFHLTDPLRNDTDADGLLDSLEYTNVVASAVPGFASSVAGLMLNSPVPYNPIYATWALDPDFDDDLLPDGVEVADYIYVADWDMNISYNTDPFIANSSRPDMIDGMAFDHDHDGLPDGLEYFGNITDPSVLSPTTMAVGGGPFNPDSDHDGLMDGEEFYIHGTNASNYDTDYDNFTDGLEIKVGTDPLNITSYEDMMAAIDAYRGDLMILSPIDDEYETTTIAVTATNFTALKSTRYEIEDMGGITVIPDTSLRYSDHRKQWEGGQIFLSKGIYTLIVTGTRPDDTQIMREVTFAMNTNLTPENLLFIASVISILSFLGVIFVFSMLTRIAPYVSKMFKTGGR